MFDQIEITERVFVEDELIQYIGRHRPTRKAVVINYHRTDLFSRDQIERFHHICSLLSKLNFKDFPCLLLIKDVYSDPFGSSLGKGIVYIYEALTGRTLNSGLINTPLSEQTFLPMALDLTNALCEIHKLGLIHGALTPFSITIDSDTSEIKMGGFGPYTSYFNPMDACIDQERKAHLNHPRAVSEILPYISPEQVRKINQAITVQSDLYSLGCIFYEMLCGRPPFIAHDLAKFVHFHMAKNPMPINAHNPDVSANTTTIIMTLLEKSPENRYQSCDALKTDIQRIIHLLNTGKKEDPIEFSRTLPSHALYIPDTFYGRKDELKILRQKLALTLKGQISNTFISGDPGIGKTSLAREFINSVKDKNQTFLIARFDRSDWDIPYHGLVKGLVQWSKTILSLSEKQLSEWKNRIMDSVGENAQILLDMIPEFKGLITPQSAIPSLSPEKSRERFMSTLLNFFRAIPSPEQSVIFFMDDLQWADKNSLLFLQRLLGQSKATGFCFIGAYRTNEAGESSALSSVVKHIIAIKGCDLVQLDPLKKEDINSIVSNTFVKKPEETGELTEIINEKTHGNPFFVKEFIRNIIQKENVFLSEKGWEFHAQQIKSMVPTDNVGTILEERLQGISGIQKDLLTVLSCLGKKFCREDLQGICGVNAEQMGEAIDILEGQGLVIKEKEDLSFSHDRFRDACFRTLSEDRRVALHHKIGMYLWKEKNSKGLLTRVFTILFHLNQALCLVKDNSQKIELARLNLMAGERAKSQAAYEAAQGYFLTGIELIGISAWEKEYQLAFNLHILAGETAFLSNDESRAETLLNLAMKKAVSSGDKIKIFENKISYYTVFNKPLKGIELGREAMAMLGMKLPEKANRIIIAVELLKSRIFLRGRAVNDLLKAQELKDERLKFSTCILSAMVEACIIGRPDYLPIVILKLLNISLKDGVSDYSPFAYAAYGIILCSVLGKTRQGFRFGQLALELSDRSGRKDIKSPVYYAYGANLHHWHHHIRTSHPYLKKAYKWAIASGDLSYASYAINQSLLHFMAGGESLGTLEKKFQENAGAMVATKQKRTIQIFDYLYSFIAKLQGKKGVFPPIQRDDFDTLRTLRRWEDANDAMGLYSYYHFEMIFCFFSKNMEGAFRFLKKADAQLDSVMGMIFYVEHFFYECMILSEFISHPSKQIRQKQPWMFVSKLKLNLTKLKKWAAQAPDNFNAFYCLAAARLTEIQNKHQKAGALYDQAVQVSDKTGFRHIQALSNECAARFYLKAGRQKIAQVYLIEAWENYQTWGASIVADRLLKEYPALLNASKYISTPPSVPQEQEQPHADPDIGSIVKATQAITEETLLDRLLEKLMAIVLENAGARKGVLVLNKQEQWVVEANVSVQDRSEFKCTSLSESKELPIAMTRFVIRTGQELSFDEAVKGGAYLNDPYINAKTLKSAVCIPLIRQEVTIGVLYLENNLLCGIFTAERMTVLRTVAKILTTAWARNQAEEDVAVYQSNLRKLSAKLLLAEEKERRRLANALHDRIGHSLHHAIMKIEQIKIGPKTELAQGLDELNGILDESIRDTRSLTFELSPPILYDLGLASALEWLGEETEKKYGLKVSCRCGKITTNVSMTINILLFQSARELLFNTVKHAGAREARISLSQKGNELNMAVTDDGKGFDPDQLQAAQNIKAGGFGLFSIKERLLGQGGELDIKSSPDQGSTVAITCKL